MIFEMPSRAAAVFIAFVLFWSAFATYGQARSPAPFGGVQAEVKGIADSAPPGQDLFGPAEQQPLSDDSTGQSEVEGGGADSPELIQPLPDPRVPALAMARPRPHEAAAWRAPTLDGLRRPPRASLPTA